MGIALPEPSGRHPVTVPAGDRVGAGGGLVAGMRISGGTSSEAGAVVLGLLFI